MFRLCAAVAFCLLTVSVAVAADEEKASLNDFLESATLPADYEAAAQELKNKEQVIGHLVVISKPDQVSKVVAQIDLSDRSKEASRRAAAKAYVNGLASTLSQQGYKVVSKKFPHFEKEKFDEPVQVDLGFKNDEGSELLIHQEIFFTDKGFVVQVVADNKKDLEALTKWAKSIKPKKTNSK